MNCSEARRSLSPYLDSELDPTTTFAISEHLRICESCRNRFEMERRADRAIIAGLDGPHMTDAVWEEAIRPLRRPRPGIWRLYAPLAAAAAIAIVVWVGWPQWNSDTPSHWIVGEFLAETTGGRAFPADGAATISAGMSMPVGPFSDLILSFSSEAALRHVVQLVRVDSIEEADGAEIVEVRLNCCGEPVIVRAARRERPGRLREFLDGPPVPPLTGKVTVTSREIGEYVVVAVSRHPVSELVGAMSVQ